MTEDLKELGLAFGQYTHRPPDASKQPEYILWRSMTGTGCTGYDGHSEYAQCLNLPFSQGITRPIAASLRTLLVAKHEQALRLTNGIVKWQKQQKKKKGIIKHHHAHRII